MSLSSEESLLGMANIELQALGIEGGTSTMMPCCNQSHMIEDTVGGKVSALDTHHAGLKCGKGCRGSNPSIQSKSRPCLAI